MGVEFYLVSDEAREKYRLGGGHWYECEVPSSRDALMETAKAVALNYDAGIGEARRFARDLAEWAEAHGGKVRIVSDAEEKYEEIIDYKETGSAFDQPRMSHDDIQKRVKQAADELCEELGADDANITVRIENTPMLDDPDERVFYEYIAISGYTEQLSGYRVVRKKQKQ